MLQGLFSDHALDVTMRIDGTMRRICASPMVEAGMCYGPEDLLGGDPCETAPPDDLPALEARISAVSAEATHRIRHEAGHHVRAEARHGFVPQDEGFVVTPRNVFAREAAGVELVATDAEHEAGRDGACALAYDTVGP